MSGLGGGIRSTECHSGLQTILFPVGSHCVRSFPLILVCLVFSCNCYKLLIIRLMKAASIDGPFGILQPALCLTLKCYIVIFFFGGANKMLACLLTVDV